MRTTQRDDPHESTARGAAGGTTRRRQHHAASESDLTARARIRDAAIDCFATEGFEATVRTIAQRAGVSAGLITHHFGSKDALRAECDAEVLRRYRELKQASLEQPTERLLEEMSDSSRHGPLLLYILRSLQAGKEAGAKFTGHLIDDARDYMAKGVASGMIKPSRDEEARLRYLTSASLGALLMEFTLASEEDKKDLSGLMGKRIRDTFLPTLELFTQGLLASPAMFDTFLAYQEEHGQLWEPQATGPPGPGADDA